MTTLYQDDTNYPTLSRTKKIQFIREELDHMSGSSIIDRHLVDILQKVIELIDEKDRKEFNRDRNRAYNAHILP